MKAHFVTFYSPGTFVAEETEKPIASWDVAKAQKMATRIKERYNAIPYGFRFTTRERGPKDLDSKVVKTSGMYFINCRRRTLAELEKENDPKKHILLSNMRINKWDSIVETVKGWKFTQPVREGDTVL